MGVSIKLCYRPSAIKGKDGTLYYQIIIKRTTHTYASGYRIYPNEWDKQHGRLLTNSSSLIKIKNRTDWEMQQIYAIAKRHFENEHDQKNQIRQFLQVGYCFQQEDYSEIYP